MSVDIMTDNITPGTIFDDIQEYIENNGLEKWAIDEQDDEADGIMDDDEGETKQKHIRLTIQSDEIDGAEERDEVKGFDLRLLSRSSSSKLRITRQEFRFKQ